MKMLTNMTICIIRTFTGVATCVDTMTCSPYKDTLSGRSQVSMRIARGLSCSPLCYLFVKCTSRKTLSPPIKLIQVKAAPCIENGCNREVG